MGVLPHKPHMSGQSYCAGPITIHWFNRHCFHNVPGPAWLGNGLQTWGNWNKKQLLHEDTWKSVGRTGEKGSPRREGSTIKASSMKQCHVLKPYILLDRWGMTYKTTEEGEYFQIRLEKSGGIGHTNSNSNIVPRWHAGNWCWCACVTHLILTTLPEGHCQRSALGKQSRTAAVVQWLSMCLWYFKAEGLAHCYGSIHSNPAANGVEATLTASLMHDEGMPFTVRGKQSHCTVKRNQPKINQTTITENTGQHI